jgi:hypothetical protein
MKYNIEQPPSGFKLWYRCYPKKVAKFAGLKAWIDLDLEDQAGKIIAATKDYPFATDAKYIPHPSTFLRGYRWLDQFDEEDGNDW